MSGRAIEAREAALAAAEAKLQEVEDAIGREGSVQPTEENLRADPEWSAAWEEMLRVERETWADVVRAQEARA